MDFSIFRSGTLVKTRWLRLMRWEEFHPALELVWRRPDADHKSRSGRKPMVIFFQRPPALGRLSRFLGLLQRRRAGVVLITQLF